MRKTIKINGKDFTDAFTPTGYTVSYIKRRGNRNNSGIMLDGSYVDDVLAIKAVVTYYCMPINETILQELLVEIAATYVQLEYYDPKEKTYRTITAMPSEPSQKYRGDGADALEYWTGTVIVFTEK